MRRIDLRSDTVTCPSAQMLEVMQNARVGDDVYGEDETTNLLQEKVAKLIGKEAALFMPSGTMSNQIGLAVHTQQGDEVLCEENAHIFYYETAAPSIISKVQLRTFFAANGVPSQEQLTDKIREDVYYYPKTKLLCLENTHNRYAGLVLNQEEVENVCSFAKGRGLKLHLDGARLWNAAVYQKKEMSQLAKVFDTVSVCFSKGLGAPVGSVLAGSYEDIQKARKWRKILGGGMRQVGVLSAACIYALDNNFSLLEKDHFNARLFAKIIKEGVKKLPLKITSKSKIVDNLDRGVAEECVVTVVGEIQTNIVVLKFGDFIDFDKVLDKSKESGLLFNQVGKNSIRLVFHLDISEEDTIMAADKLVSVLKECVYK